jgi:hypothetical protein
MALRKNMAENLMGVELMDRIRDEFVKKARKTRKGEDVSLKQGVIHKLCERLTEDHRNIDRAIDHMVKCGDIAEDNRVGMVGRATRSWTWQG